MFGLNIGNVLDFVGDWWSGDKKEDSIHAQQQHNIAAQREFAQHGLRWKVEDAKAAGLHPLFALGGSGASFSPNPVVVPEENLGTAMSKMGQNISASVARQETQDQRALRQAQLAKVWAETEESNARAWLAQTEAARVQQQMLGAPPMPPAAGNSAEAVPVVVGEMPPAVFDKGTVKPHEVPSSRFGDMARTAMDTPYWDIHNHQDRPGHHPVQIALPRADSGPGEVEIPWYRWMFEVVPENIRRFGWGWPRDIILGGRPKGPEVRGPIRR